MQHRQFWKRSPPAIAAVSVAIAVAILALRLSIPNPAEGIGFLLIVPVALAALAFGLRGGLIAASLAFAALVASTWIGSHYLSPLGYATRALALFLSGGLVGVLTERQFRDQNLLSSILDGTTDAVFVKDIAGRYRYANTALSKLLGRPVEEILGAEDPELFPGSTADRFMEHDRQVISEGEVLTFQEPTDLAGEKRTYTSIKGPIKDRAGRTVGIFGIARDTTERDVLDKANQRFLQEIEEKNAEIAAFIRIVSHHLRSPLSAILGLSSLLTRHPKSLAAEERARALASIERQAHEALGLVDDLSLLTSLAAGTLSAQPVAAPVRRIVEGSIKEMEEVDIRVIGSPEVEAWVDPDHLDRILRAFLDNCMRHGAPPIEIAFESSDTEVTVTVKDAGPGVPPDLASRLFERTSPVPHLSGLQTQRGLGLSIVTGLAAINGAVPFYEPPGSFGVRLARPPNLTRDSH